MMTCTGKVRPLADRAQRPRLTAAPRRTAGTLYGPDGSVMDPGPWNRGISRHLPYPLRGYGQHTFPDGASYECVPMPPSRAVCAPASPLCPVAAALTSAVATATSLQRDVAGGCVWRLEPEPRNPQC